MYDGIKELFCCCCGGLSFVLLQLQPRTQPERKECVQSAGVSIHLERSYGAVKNSNPLQLKSFIYDLNVSILDKDIQRKYAISFK